MLTKLQLMHVVNAQREWLKENGPKMDREISGYEELTSHAFILTGIRRCGKSTVLQQVFMQQQDESIFLNFEDPRLAGFDISDFNKLHEIALEMGCKAYFFDEIQNIDKWESFVRFKLDEGYKVFITGSNASMLSKELGTKLTGRHISKELFPFSYLEYLRFLGLEKTSETALKYLNDGGFPEYLKTSLTEVLMHNFNDILIRDIAARYTIRHTDALRQLAVWLVSNVGKPFTGNSLRKSFNINSSSSIMEFLGFLSDAYLFFFVPRFSYSHKVQLVNPKKVYCIDNGMISTNSTSFSDDQGRLLENMVYGQIRRSSAEIFYFKESKECDFVVFRNGRLEGVFQVCWQLNDDNMKRELAGLEEAMDFFKLDKGTIITFDQEDTLHIGNKTIELKPFHQWIE